MNKPVFFLENQAYASLEDLLESTSKLPAWRPFDDRAVNFTADLAKRILMHPEVKQLPEMAALAHWFRRARLEQLKQETVNNNSQYIEIGRGLAFHLVPTNVDSIFLYSCLISLLSGNVNIVRVSQTVSPQLDFLIKVLSQVFQHDGHTLIENRIVILTYPHDEKITKAISLKAMVRVVWGGDVTVNTVRSIPLRPTASEVCFPDRFSLAAISATAVMDITDNELRQLAEKFYNDAFWFAQQACSSPRIVNWVGSPAVYKLATKRFWGMLNEIIIEREPENTPAMSMSRLSSAFLLAAKELARPTIDGTQYAVKRLSMEMPLEQDTKSIHCGNGLFLEQCLDNIEQLGTQLSDKEQTLSVFGFSRPQIEKLIANLPPRALDRIVPIGQALDFSAVWDGGDLFTAFTRKISIMINHD